VIIHTFFKTLIWASFFSHTDRVQLKIRKTWQHEVHLMADEISREPQYSSVLYLLLGSSDIHFPGKPIVTALAAAIAVAILEDDGGGAGLKPLQ